MLAEAYGGAGSTSKRGGVESAVTQAIALGRTAVVDCASTRRAVLPDDPAGAAPVDMVEYAERDRSRCA